MLKHLISISALVVVASGACFDNGDKEIGGACYKFVAQKLSFADARNWCHYQNPVTASYLASVSNQFTANFLASYARSAFGQNDGYFWIGLSRNKTYTPWTWDTGYQMQWSNFDSDQLSYNYAAENIVNSKWRTFAAEEQMNFVCSYDPTSPPTFAPPTSDGPSTPTPTPTAPQTTTQTVPTTTDDGKCNPEHAMDATFLFAYSTEMDHDVFMEVKKTVLQTLNTDQRYYKHFADVRFDNRNGQTIYYHDDVESFTQSLNSHPPNKLLGFQDLSIPSNAFQVLNEFFVHGGDLCGTRVLLLMVPYPNTNDDSLMDFPVLIENRVEVFIIKTIYGGGVSAQPLNSLASKTQGLVTFANDIVTNGDTDFNTIAQIYMYAPYYQNVWFAGNMNQVQNETSSFGHYTVPGSDEEKTHGTLIITTAASDSYKDFNDFLTINVTLTETGTGKNVTLSYDRINLIGETDLISDQVSLKSGAEYAVTVGHWSIRPAFVEIRIYI